MGENSMKDHFTIPASIEKRLQAWNEWVQHQTEDEKTSKPCITISREYGCQAYLLAETLYDRLNEQTEGGEEWTLLDRLLLEKVANESGYSKSKLKYATVVNPAFQSMVTNFMGHEHADPFEVFTYTRKTIRYFAKAGNSIIVGRGVVCSTQNLPNVLHVRLVATLSFKIDIIMKNLGLTETKAREHIKARQGERDNFILHFTKMDLSDPNLYHLLINNEKSTIKQIADLILTRLKAF